MRAARAPGADPLAGAGEEGGGGLDFIWVAGQDYPEDLSPYRLMVHCGGCMVNRQETPSRINRAQRASAPIVNYGVLLAYEQDEDAYLPTGLPLTAGS